MRTMFEVVHKLPLQKQDLWIKQGYGRWITGMDDTIGVSKINSIQNGFCYGWMCINYSINTFLC